MSRTTYYRGKQRFATEGIPGLADRSSRPRCPRMAHTPDQEQAIAGIRTARGWDPARIALVRGRSRATAAGFLRRMTTHCRTLGIPVQRVQSDNGSPYGSARWKEACAELGVVARRTRPHRPQTKGKVERWFQTMQRECLYPHVLTSEGDRQVAIDAFVRYHHCDRPHLGIDGRTPLSRLAQLDN